MDMIDFTANFTFMVFWQEATSVTNHINQKSEYITSDNQIAEHNIHLVSVGTFVFKRN